MAFRFPMATSGPWCSLKRLQSSPSRSEEVRATTHPEPGYLPEGYPVSGKIGEVVANYELAYADGISGSLPVRNGMEVAQANLIDNATRIDPVATQAQPAQE